MEFIKYQILPQFNNFNVINYLKYHHLSKVKINFYCTKDTIKINGKFADLTTVLTTGDILELYVHEDIDFIPENRPINIAYEDDYLLIINKESGVIIHPDDKSKTGTLVNYVAYYFQKNKLKRNVRYLHRLDIETTGLIIFAKDFLTSSYYNYLISQHLIKREYLAICCGNLKDLKGIIEAPIGEDRHHNQRRRVSKTGQVAITNYEVIKVLKGYNFVRIVLETGRTHQIRVHMKYLGHPLAGDFLYDGRLTDIKRVALHSYSLDFPKPFSNEQLHIECDLPTDMQLVVKKYAKI